MTEKNMETTIYGLGFRVWGCPRIRGIFWGVPRIRIVGFYIRSPDLWKLPYG